MITNKKIFVLMVLGAVAQIQADAPKQESVKAIKADLKIRYINLGDAMRSSAEGTIVAKELENLERESRGAIEEKQKELTQLAAEFQGKQSTLGRDAIAKEQTKLVNLESDYKALAQKKEQEFKLANQQATGRLAGQVSDAVQDYAKQEGLDAVVDKMTGAVLYTSDKAECTNKIVEIMDTKYNTKFAAAKIDKNPATTKVAAKKNTAKKATATA